MKSGSTGARPAVESARASLAGFDAKRAGVLLRLLEGSQESKHLAGEDWTTGWGADGAVSHELRVICFHLIPVYCDSAPTRGEWGLWIAGVI